MRPYTIKIPAGAVEDLSVDGRYLRLHSASVAVTIENPDHSESAELEQGDAVEFSPFQRLRLSHSDGAEQTVKVYVGKGTRLISARVGGSLVIANFPANGGGYSQGRATVLTSGVSTLLAANASRRACLLQNNSAADYVRITTDGTTPTGSVGFRLAPGAYWELPAFMATGAIKAIAETGTGAAVEYAEG